VIDGKPPKLKERILKERRKIKDKFKKLEEAATTDEEKSKFAKSALQIKDEHIAYLIE